MKTYFDNYFDDVFGMFGSQSYPRYHSEKTDEGYLIELPVPGLTEKDLDVSIFGGRLHIKTTTDDHRWCKTFETRFLLPDMIDQNKSKATVENGIIKIELPFGKEHKKEIKLLN